MIPNEIRVRLRTMAEDLEGRYRVLSNEERATWAANIRAALEILHPSSNGVAPVTRGDVYMLRQHAKHMRGQPGLVRKTIWPTDLANRLEEYLDAVGAEYVDS